MNKLKYLPFAIVLLAFAGCGPAPYEGNAEQGQLADEDAARRAEEGPSGGTVIPGFDVDGVDNSTETEETD